MSQTLIVVDENDTFVRYAPREECHAGEGILHRAIMILLYNEEKKILLQKRKHQLFDDMWDLAGATHPLHLADGDESYEKCGARCLRDEWGIATPLTRTVAFTYFAPDGERCENEYCMVMAGEYSGALTPNPEHAYAHRWVSWGDLLEEVASQPDAFTPWLKLALREIRTHEIGRMLAGD